MKVVWVSAFDDPKFIINLTGRHKCHTLQKTKSNLSSNPALQLFINTIHATTPHKAEAL